MAGILPDAGSGGQVIRDTNGVCTNPANVTNAFCPPAAFDSSCALTALPNDCTARITPAQINALVSEMISFAACMNPDGVWTCGSVTNLCTAFTAWTAENKIVDGTTIIGTGTVADPFRVNPDEVVTAICADDSAGDALAACLVSTDAGNVLTTGTDGRLLYNGAPVALPTAQAICADNAARDTLAACLISGDAGNIIIPSPGDGGLFATASARRLSGGSPTVVGPSVLTTAGAEVLNSQGTFVIPNSGAVPIQVMLTLIHNSDLIVNDPVAAGASSARHRASIFAGAVPGASGTGLANTQSVLSKSPTQETSNQTPSDTTLVTIAPGGSTFTLANYVSGLGQGNGAIQSPSVKAVWYGVQSQLAN